jgi:hypothetical protein
LKNLKKFNVSELKPGQFIERGFEDTPDFPEFFSSNPSQEIFRLKPGQYIEERTCGTKKDPEYDT